MKLGIILALVFAVQAAMGLETTNNGIYIGGKLYSLDLAEAGVEKNPFFDTYNPIDAFLLERVEQKFDRYNFPVDLIARKLTEVKRADFVYAMILLKTMEMYQWNLVDIPSNSPDSQQMVRIASRGPSTIQLNNLLWNQLDEANRTAVVFNQVLYALIRPQPIKPKSKIMAQSSARSREVSGYLFKKEFYEDNGGTKAFYALSRILGEDYMNNWTLFGTAPIWELGNELNYSSQVRLDFDDLPWPNSVDMRHITNPSLKSSDSELAIYVHQICEIVVSRGFPLFVYHGNAEAQLKFSSFQTESGGRSYVASSYKWNTYRSRVKYKGMKSCLKNAYKELAGSIDFVNEWYAIK